ncbi:DUF397 domain-containing protein [Streptomyces sp. DSM 44917]|uniref:DUF397 domain-containing protein n=1 Tax=Streptomyces boetiae TaxID=3075541 RepID=A0ABU2LF01_9ACTN|nr:DUF397 domain-containing protein [Streptomyces sp. DSM 44917]MDT0309758.1 DUF397 domain-containing protein [Streptomyces sp. DSM 44917]
MNRVDLHNSAPWSKSSHSNGNGDCVEVAFVRSSYSNGIGECVEVADLGGKVAMRDSKQHEGAVVVTSSEGWRSFVAHVVNDEFDRA